MSIQDFCRRKSSDIARLSASELLDRQTHRQMARPYLVHSPDGGPSLVDLSLYLPLLLFDCVEELHYTPETLDNRMTNGSGTIL